MPDVIAADEDALFRTFLDDPLCGPRETAPTEFWGPETFDGSSWQEFAGRLKPEQEIASLLGALGGASSVLDVGGGNGLISRSVAARFGTCTVVEPNATNLERLQEAAEDSLRVVRGTAEDLPFADSEFDAVISTWVLQYASSPRRAVTEMARVCTKTPGGRVLLVQAAPWNELVTLYNVCARGLSLRPAHHGFLLASAAARLHRAGFTDISFTVTPVRLSFSDPSLEQKVEAAIRLSYGLHFGGTALAPSLEMELRATALAMFEKSPLSLNDDGVLLTAKVG